MKVYIAGPISGKEQGNYESFKQAADRINSAGHKAVNPHWLGIKKGAPWNECMRHCIKAMAGCDMVFALDGWESSAGAKIEVDLAIKIGIPVIFEHEGYELLEGLS